MNEFLHLFQAGGFMMYPLLAASIIAVAITVERARMYRKSKTDMTLLASHLSKPLHEGKLFEAEKIAANAGGLTGDLILKAIAHERHIDDMASWLEMEGAAPRGFSQGKSRDSLRHRDARASYGASRNGARYDPVV